MSQIGAIQILRALAALLVAFGHFQHEASTLPTAASSGFAPIIIDLTGAGVDLFFIISGFVMVYASHDLFESRDGGRLFLTRRIARIVPLYWMMTTLFLLTLALTPNVLSSIAPTGLEILKSYLFIPYARDGAEMIQPIYKLGWTLEYEMFFYVIFSLVLFLPMRSAVFAIALLFCSLSAVGAWLSPAPALLAFWTHPIILEFVMGALIAVVYLGGRRLSAAQRITLLLAGVSGFAATAAFGFDAHGPWRPLLWGLPAAMIVAGSILHSSRTSANRVTRWLVALGDASYVIYLVHPMIIRALRVIWDRTHASSTISPWLFVIFGLTILMPLAILVHHAIERPMTKRVQRLFKLRRPSTPVALSLSSGLEMAESTPPANRFHPASSTPATAAPHYKG
jgi:exopolysaccharide production protein ExoZ